MAAGSALIGCGKIPRGNGTSTRTSRRFGALFQVAGLPML